MVWLWNLLRVSPFPTVHTALKVRMKIQIIMFVFVLLGKRYTGSMGDNQKTLSIQLQKFLDQILSILQGEAEINRT